MIKGDCDLNESETGFHTRVAEIQPKSGQVDMTVSPTDPHAEFEALIVELRPELHRYASRMTGSVIDGEDVVQEALAKAYSSLSSLAVDSNLRGWLFRITHNKAINFLRQEN